MIRLKSFDPVITAVFGRRFPRWDAVMVTLAAVNVILLVIVREAPGIPDAWVQRLLWADWAFVAVYAAEFLVSLSRSDAKARFVRANWYDLVGLIPLPIPFLRAFRLLRIPHVLVWGTRFPAEADRRWGGPYALSVIREHERALVMDLTDPLLVRLLEILRNAVRKGRFAEKFGENLDARRPRLRRVVRDALESKPAVRYAFLAAPGAGRAVDTVQDQLVDVLVKALTDPELDAVIRESLDGSLSDLQARIRTREATAEPGSSAE